MSAGFLRPGQSFSVGYPLKGHLLAFEGGCEFVPLDSDIRKALLHVCHFSLHVVHCRFNDVLTHAFNREFSVVLEIIGCYNRCPVLGDRLLPFTCQRIAAVAPGARHGKHHRRQTHCKILQMFHFADILILVW